MREAFTWEWFDAELLLQAVNVGNSNGLVLACSVSSVRPTSSRASASGLQLMQPIPSSAQLPGDQVAQRSHAAVGGAVQPPSHAGQCQACWTESEKAVVELEEQVG